MYGNSTERPSAGFFPVFWEHGPYPWDWEFQRCFVKNWEILQLIKWTQNNHYLGWQVQSFKHYTRDVARVSNISEIFIKSFNFVTFN